MKSPFVFAVVLLTGALVPCSCRRGEPESRRNVEPFALSEVRLLEGSRFHQAQELNREFLLRYEPDRLLAWFRKEAGLEPKAEVYGGWESMGIAGHSLGHYLSACSQMYASTGDRRFQERVNYIVAELRECQRADGTGYTMAVPEGRRVFAEVARGEIKTKRFDLNGVWVPLYTLHKVMGGLRDAWRLAGNSDALEVETHLGAWIEKTFASVSDEQMQRVLYCEHGGINEVLADLSVDTGEPRFLELARRFHHREVLDPMIEGRDMLPGYHANTQIPKIAGMARIYEVGGDAERRRGAEFFWERVAHHHSYVTGGNCLRECFGPADSFSGRLGKATTESCNVYNMLKLTRLLFSSDPKPDYFDFYERALYNHILSTQHPESGRTIYNLTLSMGGAKQYQDPESFTCCLGSGMENHSKYGESIYFHSDRELYVNLFIPSELAWDARGIRVRLETRYPEEDTVRLTFSDVADPGFTLKIRYPKWAVNGAEATVNGEPVPVDGDPASYIAIQREWRAGDRVEVRFPMSLRLEAMPDDSRRAAVLYGPLVLAGDLGPADDREAVRGDYVPVIVGADLDPAKWLEPVARTPNRFRMSGVGDPRGVDLAPFYTVHDRRYTVYWDFFSSAEWEREKVRYRAARTRENDVEARTVSLVHAGEDQMENRFRPEMENAIASWGPGGRRVRQGAAVRAAQSFSYEMRVPEKGPAALVLNLWNEPGAGPRGFVLSVDGINVAREALEQGSGGYIEKEYPLPTDAIAGRKTVRVRFESPENMTLAAVDTVRIVQR